MTPHDKFFIEFWMIPQSTLTVAYLVLVQVMNRYLRSHHPAVWDRQGRMTFFNNSMANGWRFLKFFIFNSEYKTLGDSRLDRYALVLRVLFWACAAGFAIGVTLVGLQPHR